MKPGFKTFLICLLGAFVLLGQVLLKNNQSAALFSGGQASPVACESNDDPVSDDTLHAAILVSREPVVFILTQNMHGVFNTGIKPDFRGAHFLPDTRGSPLV